MNECEWELSGGFLAGLTALRKSLDTLGRTIAISADEWGLGPPWLVEHFAAAHGVYAATFLGVAIRVSDQLDLRHTNYFEPVNEGAIQVGACCKLRLRSFFQRCKAFLFSQQLRPYR